MAQTRNVRPPTVEEFMGCYAWAEKEAATQTFLNGALLVHSAGYAQESAADPADGTVLGIANGPGHNATAAGDEDIQFTPFKPGMIIEANLCSGAANAHVLVETNRWAQFGMIKRTVAGALHWVIDVTETDAADVMGRVVGFRDDVGDTNARVYFAIKSAKCAFGG